MTDKQKPEIIRMRELGAGSKISEVTGVLEKVTAVNEADFEREKAYQITMSLVRQLRKNGIVTEEEYKKVDTIMLEKHRPVLGTLLSGKPLI